MKRLRLVLVQGWVEGLDLGFMVYGLWFRGKDMRDGQAMVGGGGEQRTGINRSARRLAGRARASHLRLTSSGFRV